MSTSPFRKSSQTAVESRPVVVDTGGEVVVEVGRVIDARGPQGRARQRYPGRLLAPGEFVPPAVVDFIGRQFDLYGAEAGRADRRTSGASTRAREGSTARCKSAAHP